jgi:protein subunit release factor B
MTTTLTPSPISVAAVTKGAALLDEKIPGWFNQMEHAHGAGHERHAVVKPILSVTIADCEVQDFRSGGPGGQNQNKRSTGQRVIHHPSGARGESREERSQLQNKKTAFLRMIGTPKFKVWLNRELYQMSSGETAEQRAEKDMDPRNLKVEVRGDDGKWVEE